MQLMLTLSNNGKWELSEIIFKSNLIKPKISRRGKSLVYSDDDGCFQWTRAVKACCLLVVGTKLSLIKNEKNIFFMQGSSGSVSASLFQNMKNHSLVKIFILQQKKLDTQILYMRYCNLKKKFRIKI